MNFTEHKAPQGTQEWLAARAGRLTGSRSGDMMAKGAGKTRQKYLRQLLAERMTNTPAAGIKQTEAMRRGNELEPLARMAYEGITGKLVRETGFLAHNTMMAGCSLDGDVDNFRRIVEFKCPDSTTHLEYLQNPEALFSEYRWQVTHNLWLTGAESCDLMSFDDRFTDPEMQAVMIYIPRSRVDVAGYEVEAVAFLREIDDLHRSLLTRKAT